MGAVHGSNKVWHVSDILDNVVYMGTVNNSNNT